MGDKIKLFLRIFISGSLLLLFTSCGDLETVFSDINLKFDASTDEVEFTVVMNESFTFPVQLLVPIPNYGQIEIVPSSWGNPAQVILTANLKNIAKIEGDLVSTLPNGTNFPSYIKGPLVEIEIKENYYAYLSPDTLQYIGFTVLIPSINKYFPENLMLATPFKDKEGQLLGAAVIFGPKKNGSSVLVPGGIFAVADITNIVDEITLENALMSDLDSDMAEDVGIRSFSGNSIIEKQGYAGDTYNPTRFKMRKKQYKSLRRGGYME